MTALYRMDGIAMEHGGKVVLSVPALEIREGAVHALLGPNGSGKSTLLSVLAFLAPPSAGALFYEGNRVEWNPGPLTTLRREATLLHQSPYLFDESVEDNLSFGLAIRGIRGEERRRRIAESLEAVGLPGFGTRKGKALSGGEAQRVAMARALALHPRVLLLDEPLANVDRESAEVLMDVVAGLPGKGTTVLLATHDPALPGQIGCEVIRLEEGRPVEANADI